MRLLPDLGSGIDRTMTGGVVASRTWCFTGAVWLFVMLLTPLLLRQGGVSVLVLVTALVASQLLVVLLPLWSSWGTSRFLIATLTVAFLSWGSEAIGVATGFPFGGYRYSDLLSPKWMGVPVLIPLAWMMMLIPSWGVAYSILGDDVRSGKGGFRHHLMAGTFSGLAMVAWDLYVDPQMVAMGIWEWATPSGYFGTPLSNFAGWWLVAFLLTILVRPSNLPTRPLLIVYSATWLLEFFGLWFFWGQPRPALWGLAGMGALVMLAWKKELGVREPDRAGDRAAA